MLSLKAKLPLTSAGAVLCVCTQDRSVLPEGASLVVPFVDVTELNLALLLLLKLS